MNIPVTAEINKEIEPVPQSFKDICDGPSQLLAFIIKYLSFSADITNNYIKSENAPTGENKKHIWIKTSWPYGIGAYIDGEWKMDYGMSGYPINMPFLHSTIADLRVGLRALTDAEVTAYGINNTAATATNRLYWYIFNPPEIT